MRVFTDWVENFSACTPLQRRRKDRNNRSFGLRKESARAAASSSRSLRPSLRVSLSPVSLSPDATRRDATRRWLVRFR